MTLQEMKDEATREFQELLRAQSLHSTRVVLSIVESLLTIAYEEGRKSILSDSDRRNLTDLHEICVDDDLLDLPDYDSIERADKIANAWAALKVIESLIKESPL